MVWLMGKVLFPVTFLVAVLQHTPVIDWVIRLIEPLMRWIGLPGEAAIPLALGNVLNLYAAIGAVLTLDFTVKEVFIIAVMLSFSHNLFVEGAICKRVGVSLLAISAIRLMMAFSTGFIIHLVWSGGGEAAKYGLVAPEEVTVSGVFPIVGHALKTAVTGTLQFSVVIFALMVMIQILRDLRVLDYFSQKLASSMHFLGIPDRGAITMAAGLLFGLAFGAGVIIEQAQKQAFSKRDLYIMLLFLSGCHAVVEDTLIFVPLGIPVWTLLLLRVAVAIVLTILVARIWRRRGVEGLPAEGTWEGSPTPKS